MGCLKIVTKCIRSHVKAVCEIGRELKRVGSKKEASFVYQFFPIHSQDSTVEHVMIIRRERKESHHGVNDKVVFKPSMDLIADLACNVADKISDPLSSASLLIEHLLQGEMSSLSKSVCEQLQLILDQIKSLSEVRQNLLSFSLATSNESISMIASQVDFVAWLYRERYLDYHIQVDCSGLEILPSVDLPLHKVRGFLLVMAEYALLLGRTGSNVNLVFGWIPGW